MNFSSPEKITTPKNSGHETHQEIVVKSPKNNFLQWHFEGKKHPAFSDFNQPEM